MAMNATVGAGGEVRVFDGAAVTAQWIDCDEGERLFVLDDRIAQIINALEANGSAQALAAAQAVRQTGRIVGRFINRGEGWLKKVPTVPPAVVGSVHSCIVRSINGSVVAEIAPGSEVKIPARCATGLAVGDVVRVRISRMGQARPVGIPV